MDVVFIVSPIVGSIIGYFTNWLAIKMLFRPLTEKKIFGFKIPLTPGVIPRRRDKLAQSIGGTVGKRLLTPDAFERILQSPEMQSKVQEFIKSKIKDLENEDKSLEDALKQIFKNEEKIIELKKLIKSIIEQNLVKLVSSEQVVELIKSELTVDNAKKLKNYLESQHHSQLKEYLRKTIKDQAKSDWLKEELLNYIKDELESAQQENKKLKDIIPSQVIILIKEYIKEQEPQIIEHLTTILDSEILKNKIESKVDEFFENNPMLSMLSGFKDKIVDKFLNYLVSFVKEEENQEYIVNQIDELIDSVLNTKVELLAQKINNDDLEVISEQIVKKIVNERNINKIVSNIEKKLIATMGTNKGKKIVENSLKKIINSNLLITSLNKLIDIKVEQLFKMQISDCFKQLSSTKIDKLELLLVNIIEYIMEHHLGKVFASLDFKTLVKEKINSFDVLEVERLLLDVIETELKAITWFGAVLGFLLGLITPIISLF